MKDTAKILVPLCIFLLATGAWIAHFHSTWVTGFVPKPLLDKIAEAPASDDSSGDSTDAEVPVHAVKVARFTFHRYIDGYGAIAPRPAGVPGPAGSASIAAPSAGVVADVLCQAGQKVAKGDPLIQLDDRLAKAAEDQAAAALAQAQASLANLKATPRPQQLEIAKLAVEKSQTALDFAQKNDQRQKDLAAQQGTSGKNVEQADMDLASAQNDLAVNQNQLNLLQQSPTPEELNEEDAKVQQAQAAFAAAQAERQMLKILSPIDATVMDIDVNPGEAVDTTKTLVDLVDLDHLTVDVDVPAAQLGSLAKGHDCLIIPDASQTAFHGAVSFISPQVDPKTGSVQVTIDLAPGTSLAPGLTVTVRIIAETHADKLAVPRPSVVTDDDGNNIVCVVADDKAKHKKVSVGFQEGNFVEIDGAGVKEGDAVVTGGAYGLPDATDVKILDDASVDSSGATQPAVAPASQPAHD